MTIYITANFDGPGKGTRYPPQMKADMANEQCEICQRLWGEHSQQEYEDCWDEVLKRGKGKTQQ